MKRICFFIMVSLVLMTGCGKQQRGSSPSKDVEPPLLEPDISSPADIESNNPSLSGETEPLYQKSQEYSITIDGKSLGLGNQVGSFPWGTSLEKQSSENWRMDGFEITCEDGTIIQGLRKEGSEDETDGLITVIKTNNPACQTYRGACVGMKATDMLALYPEAVPAKADQMGYCFVDEGIGFKQIFFWIGDDVLSSIVM